ncbi:hypothetical protein HPB49_004515 [Dermacentor silvarum]|uniref:Uncharacterized protein n=1 Tax=Dermacentor silvarum TaxID=543639 RepID=A0ACB8CVC1_DERSI|nr:hypothetical protein HPB49_004515 [Dermacentor silvarum]
MAGKDAGKQDTNLKELSDLAKALETFRRDIRAKTREIKDGISELKDGVSYCTDICNDVKDTAAEIKNLRMEMQQLLKQNMDLEAENAKLTQRCEELEQYQRLNNLEVKGAPTGSNPLTVIGESVGECVEDDDVDTCHWVHTPKPGVQNIIVRFVRRSKRNALLSKRDKNKTIKVGKVTAGYLSANPDEDRIRAHQGSVLRTGSQDASLLFVAYALR